MGKNIRAKPKKAIKKVVFTEAEFERQKQKWIKDATNVAAGIMGKLAVACIAQNHALSDDEIYKDITDIAHWWQAYDEHYLSIAEIDAVIKKHGGIDMLNFEV